MTATMPPVRTIRDWPREDQPVERLLMHGPGILSTTELVAILLQPAHRKADQNALELAREIILTFSGAHELAGRDAGELCRLPGMNRMKAAVLKAAVELGKRISTPDIERVAFGSSTDVAQYYLPRLRDLKHEIFKVLLLDARNQLIKDVTVSEGSLTASIVHPREVFKQAVIESAASVIFIHNHPSGDPTPSNDDLNITAQLVSAGRMIDIRVLDHIIIGNSTFTSLASKGMI